jgi:predicted Fe-Mo cluster-binding NifX family protein
MTDLEIAKTELYEDNLTLAIVKNGSLLYSTKDSRISGFLDAIDKLGGQLEGASLADKIAGRAIALLCVYAGIDQVYAAVVSRRALPVFKQYRILVSWNELVENVLDEKKNGMCPFEQAAAQLSQPQAAYETFKRMAASFKACKK